MRIGSFGLYRSDRIVRIASFGSHRSDRIVRIASFESHRSDRIVRIASFESHHFPGCRCAPPRATEPSSPTGWFGIGADSRICNECGIGRPLGLPGLVAQTSTMRGMRTPLGVRGIYQPLICRISCINVLSMVIFDEACRITSMTCKIRFR